jgi:hypothetical protein
MTEQSSLSSPGSKALAPCSRFWRGAAVYAPLFLGYTDYGSSFGSFCWCREVKPYTLPPSPLCCLTYPAYRPYVRRVSRLNNPTIAMLFACISFRILRSCCPFDCAFKLAYRQYIHWTRKECRKPLKNVPYIHTFGMPDQGQMLDVQESQTAKSALRDDWTRNIPHHTLEVVLLNICAQD